MERVRKLLSIDTIHNYGITGKNIGVCILDTGVSPHKDLAHQIVCFQDFLFNKKHLYDDNGHGTHVAGIVAGSGELSGGLYRGIAPDAKLIVLKCLDGKGKGKTKQALQAFDFIKKNHEKYNIRIVNISIGSEYNRNDNECRVLMEAVEDLWKAGFIVVAAAGNNGPGRETITLPGCAKSIITVGASDDANNQRSLTSYRQHYSGRGPTEHCIVKPELVAPGTQIISCAVERNSTKKNQYNVQTGTSMATPVVSGCIALLLERYPLFTNKEVKKHLYHTADDLGVSKSHQGWGQINPVKLLNINGLISK